MTDIEVKPEAVEPTAREQLFPEGWNKPKQSEATEQADMFGKDEPESEQPDVEAQSEEQEEDVSEVEASAPEGKLTVGQVTKGMGWSHEEFFNDILLNVDGEQKTISSLVDESRAVKESQEALLRERQALQERLNQTAATPPPNQGVSPEAQALMSQAQIYQQVLASTDWTTMDPGSAASQKVDLQMAIGQLQQQAQAKQLEYQQDVQTQIGQAMAEAERQVRALIPEWSDASVMNTERKAIVDMLRSYRLGDEEVATIYDPRIWRLLRDANKALMTGKRIAEGAKKVRKVGKTLGAGSRAPEGKPSPEQLKRKMKNAKSREARQALRLQMPLD